MTKNSPKGLRYNTNKPRWSLVDFPSLEPMVRVLEFGAKKYDDHNWKKGLSYTECTESLLRHVFAFLKGEDIDPESGLSHLGHIQCNAMFLSYMKEHHPELDDRYKELTPDGYTHEEVMEIQEEAQTKMWSPGPPEDYTHVTSTGQTIQLRDINIVHLNNIISKLKREESEDVHIYQAELNRRYNEG